MLSIEYILLNAGYYKIYVLIKEFEQLVIYYILIAPQKENIGIEFLYIIQLYL